VNLIIWFSGIVVQVTGQGRSDHSQH